MAAWQLTTRHESGSVVVTVTGELDLATRPDLSAYVFGLLSARPGVVVVDLSGITFIDACGLGALVVLNRHARLCLTGASPPVHRILRLTGLALDPIPSRVG